MQNTLSQASSPYLLQHKDNPVHWQQWTDDVIQKARDLNKPILLSIGYSSCHWCHVMAHESFEDSAVASVMNDHFVNIKLDREERPDLDKTYQLAHQLLNRQAGGWPLTAVLDPDTLVPFFSGTYFPKEPRYGLPAFTELLQKIHEVFYSKFDDIQEQNERLTNALKSISSGTTSATNELADDLATRLVESLIDNSDERYGGMQGAPKFPQPAMWYAALSMLPANHQTERQEKLQGLVKKALDGFTRYGLFDHLSGGFFRYCVDERWDIPHFEKMLYDNGQLLSLLSEAGHYFAQGEWIQAVEQTTHWLKEQMLSTEGGFYSALDADSEDENGNSHEGAYYAWEPKEFECLSDDEEIFAKAFFGLNSKSNFEGQWHLVTRKKWQEVADECGFHYKQAPILLESARQQLKARRDERKLPFRDDKILTSWNGLMLQGLLQAQKAGINSDVETLIYNAKNFIRQTMWQDGRLMSCYREGKAYQHGFLDDYGYLAKALLLSLSQQFNIKDWEWLQQLCHVLWEQFADHENGGFYFTSNDHPVVITRHKSWSDDAMPSSASQALEVLWVMAEMTNNLEWLEFVEKSLLTASKEAVQAPMQYPSLIRLSELWKKGLELWCVRGEVHELTDWHEYLSTGLNPGRWVFAISRDINDKNIDDKFPATEQLCAYCCRERQCFPAITQREKLQEFMGEI